MKVVIDIPTGLFLKGLREIGEIEVVKEAIRHGAPLPKGHGRLIDAEELKKYYPHGVDWEYPVNTNRYVVESIDNAPTIIEADGG